MPVVISLCDLRGAASGEKKRPMLMTPYSLQQQAQQAGNARRAVQAAAIGCDASSCCMLACNCVKDVKHHFFCDLEQEHAGQRRFRTACFLGWVSSAAPIHM
eukprot:GHRQ01008200.1.p5 GENE.GHRQ01008200.1~~GHRQ01008200.1.p5  ORF type:complete len:102 (-),score=27.27 GHRQ01008200.1:1348-1653(-)